METVQLLGALGHLHACGDLGAADGGFPGGLAVSADIHAAGAAHGAGEGGEDILGSLGVVVRAEGILFVGVLGCQNLDAEAAAGGAVHVLVAGILPHLQHDAGGGGAGVGVQRGGQLRVLAEQGFLRQQNAGGRGQTVVEQIGQGAHPDQLFHGFFPGREGRIGGIEVINVDGLRQLQGIGGGGAALGGGAVFGTGALLGGQAEYAALGGDVTGISDVGDVAALGTGDAAGNSAAAGFAAVHYGAGGRLRQIKGQLVLEGQIAFVGDPQVFQIGVAWFPVFVVENGAGGCILPGSIVCGIVGEFHADVQSTGLDDVAAAGDRIGKPGEGGSYEHTQAQDQGQDALEQGTLFVFHNSSLGGVVKDCRVGAYLHRWLQAFRWGQAPTLRFGAAGKQRGYRNWYPTPQSGSGVGVGI